MDAPVVAVSDDGIIGAAWMDMRADSGDRDVQWTVGKRGALAAEMRVNDDGKGRQGHPSLAFDRAGTLWCAWEDARAGDEAQRIYVADYRSKKNVQVSADAEERCAFPSLCVSGDTVAVAYETPRGVSLRLISR